MQQKLRHLSIHPTLLVPGVHMALIPGPNLLTVPFLDHINVLKEERDYKVWHLVAGE